MSIKDLFGRKTVVITNAESGSIDAESPKYILNRIEQEETFVPPVDFSTASNTDDWANSKSFCFFDKFSIETFISSKVANAEFIFTMRLPTANNIPSI